MTGADAPRKLGTHNERSPGKCGEDGRLKEAKPSPKVNHLPLVLRPGRARKLFECSFGRKSKKEAFPKMFNETTSKQVSTELGRGTEQRGEEGGFHLCFYW